jgi:cation diffusion facilitator family transporter
MPEEEPQTAHTHAQDAGRHDYEHGGSARLRGGGFVSRLRDSVPFLHGHEHSEPDMDAALESSAKGIKAVKLSLLLLAATAAFQVVVVLISGSVALLADTVHNFTDALTALPLWLALALSRRPASRRFTYGLGRAEDLAGVLILAVILVSALVAGYESYRRLIDPQPLDYIEWVMIAAVIGFLGNEAVAVLRIRVGREIGSAALIADGQHARVDGLTSLAVLCGAVGVLAGAPIADPIVGVVITLVILFILKDATVMIWHRLMDGIDPEVLRQLEHAAHHAIEGRAGVHDVGDLRVRWLGHKLQAELSLTVDEDLSTKDSHERAEEVRHALFHASPRLSSIIIHVEPDGHGGEDPHRLTDHHRAASV